MTALLEAVLKKASKLPESLQDEIAHELMEEIAWEEETDTSVIDAMAQQALAEFEAGETKEVGWDEL